MRIRFNLISIGLAINSILLILLLGLSPYATSFTPCPEIYTKNIYTADFMADPLYRQRAALILVGMGSSVFALALLLAGFWWVGMLEPRRMRAHFSGLFLLASETLCIWSIGWRSFPFWVNGVFAYRADFDPKCLMPMTWEIGGFWLLGFWLLYPITFFGGIIVLLAAVSHAHRAGWRQPWLSWFWLTVTCLLITLAFNVFSPEYTDWLVD